MKSDSEVILRDCLTASDAQTFDYLIVDCPPSLGVLTLNALTAVNEVFLPLQPHFLALHGLSKLLRTIGLGHPAAQCTAAAQRRCALHVRYGHAIGRRGQFGRRGVLQVPGRGRSGVWAAARTFSTRIRRNIRLAESPSFGQSIFQYAAASHGAENYRHLAEEVMSMASTQLAADPLRAAA